MEETPSQISTLKRGERKGYISLFGFSAKIHEAIFIGARKSEARAKPAFKANAYRETETNKNKERRRRW